MQQDTQNKKQELTQLKKENEALKKIVSDNKATLAKFLKYISQKKEKKSLNEDSNILNELKKELEMMNDTNTEETE